MNCQQLKENLFNLVEGNLPAGAVDAMNQHLAQCRQCSFVHDEFKASLSVLETDEPFKVDPWFAARVEQQFIDMQNDNKNLRFELVPTLRLIKAIPVAASLILALFIGILIGSELSATFQETRQAADYSEHYFDDVITTDMYEGSLEAFFLTNGDH